MVHGSPGMAVCALCLAEQGVLNMPMLEISIAPKAACRRNERRLSGKTFIPVDPLSSSRRERCAASIFYAMAWLEIAATR
ncbi:hypothetical protein HYPGJ_20030 [Hyphomicrobium sp. GJ21]|nr:hypothetical protein HYPGJ_20030 [Hyphomicrobium sp. GJ21]